MKTKLQTTCVTESLNDSQIAHPIHEPIRTRSAAVWGARGASRSVPESFNALRLAFDTAPLRVPFMEGASIRNLILTPVIVALALLTAGCLSRPPLARQDFILQTPPVARQPASPVGGVLALTSCDVSPPFASQALVYRIGPNAFETDPYAGFLVKPDKTLAIAIRTWLARSGLFTNVVEQGSSVPADQSLEIYVDELYGDLQTPDKPQAVLSLTLMLFDAKKGKGSQVLFQKQYSRHLPVAQNTAVAIVAGWDQALGEIMNEFASDFATAHKPVAAIPQP